MVLLPKAVVDACKYYLTKLEKDKEAAAEKSDLSIEMYSKLVRNEAEQGHLSEKELNERLELIKKEWAYWCFNEVNSIELQEAQINTFLRMNMRGE